MSASIFRIEAQGVGPIAETFAIPAGEIYRVISVELHLNLASTTALEYFTVTHDSSAGANYDTILYRLDPAVVPTIDLLWQPHLKPRPPWFREHLDLPPVLLDDAVGDVQP